MSAEQQSKAGEEWESAVVASSCTSTVNAENTNSVVSCTAATSKSEGGTRRKLSLGGRLCPKIQRTLILRIALVASLFVAAALCFVVSYLVIGNLERSVGEQTYESIAKSAMQNAQSVTRRKLQGNEVMASILSYAFPDASMWPYVSLDGYTEINKQLGTMSLSAEHGLVRFVDPEKVNLQEFEDFMREMYVKKGFEDHVGYSDFGFGIWKKDPSSPYDDGRVRDTTGEVSYGSNYKVLAPLTELAHKKSTHMLFNVHSETFRGNAIDSIFQCVEESAKNLISTMPKCTAVTDLLEKLLHVKGPAGVIFTPIFPKNDPNTVVGVTAAVVFWEEVLYNIVPSYVDGLVCVISTGKHTATFEIRGGQPVHLGMEDLHDPAFDAFAHSLILDDIETGAAANVEYKLTVYPTDVMFTHFSTKSPLYVALGFLSAIALCTALFVLYDYLMRHEAYQRKRIMDMKRRFVRFVSHEIRTPLNTVSLGLELLEGETSDRARVVSNKHEKIDVKDIDLWHFVAQEARENVLSAVSVLNDILNYDKIESGTLNLEIDNVDIWDLLIETVNQFRIQAINRKVDLNLTIQRREGELLEKEELDLEFGHLEHNNVKKNDNFNVVGDVLRLGQVLRNVLSNALKFTPAEGTVHVMASHLQSGLPNAKPIAADGSSGTQHPLTVTQPRAGSIRIRVEDSGVGLTPDRLQQLFGEGVQFDANKLQHGGGSGLGLSIAKGIVEQHSGTIKAESDGPGHGTSLTIELPLHEIEIMNDNESPSTESSHSAPSSHNEQQRASPSGATSTPKTLPGRRRVLLAEDVESSRKMWIRLLERSGHTCVAASNGEEAVRYVANDLAAASSETNHVPFDTILMDFEMPLLNGPEATEKIRQLGFRGTIFGVTGNILREDVEFFKSKGADEVLSKPVRMATLNDHWRARSEM